MSSSQSYFLLLCWPLNPPTLLSFQISNLNKAQQWGQCWHLKTNIKKKKRNSKMSLGSHWCLVGVFLLAVGRPISVKNCSMADLRCPTFCMWWCPWRPSICTHPYRRCASGCASKLLLGFLWGFKNTFGQEAQRLHFLFCQNLACFSLCCARCFAIPP